MKILAIETSCDETAAAVVDNGTAVITSTIASSQAMQESWGGIVPEIAAREQLRCIIPVIADAVLNTSGVKSAKTRGMLNLKPIIASEIDAVAVTVGPGLVGSLLIGVEAAKTIAAACCKPIIPVNHVAAHMYANFIRDNAVADPEVIFPAVSLVTSGGHTELYLMKNPQTLTWLGGTLDDAAGEAFDKTARLLGFGGGGGGAIQAAAQRTGTRNIPKRAVLPRPLLRDDSLNFSFSGLKTAVMKNWGKTRHTEKNAEALAYEIQEAITDVLCTKTIRAALRYGAGSILVSGGVAANSRLRDKFTKACRGHFRLHVPPVRYCTDNAVTIAACAYFRNHPQPWKSVVARPDLSVEIAD